MSSLYTLEGWPSSPSSDNLAHKYNNDTGIWDTGGAPANTPFTGQVTSSPNPPVARQQGGWDGAFWYVIGPDGKLYQYNPSNNTWSTVRAGGAVIVSGTITAQHWCMCSDGRFLYILSSGGSDFIRYDPVNDILRTMPSIPGASYSYAMFLVYDGNDTIYGLKGDGSTNRVQKFSISTAGWSALPAMPSSIDVGFDCYAAFLQSQLVMLFQDTGFIYRAVVWNGSAWTLKSTTTNDLHMGVGAPTGSPVYGEDTDSTIRLWPRFASGNGLVYNVLTDTWTTPATAFPFTLQQGCNQAVARVFSPAFSWFLADGVTPAPPTVSEGTVNENGTLSFQLVCQTPVACPNGVQVSVPALISSDAAQPVTISATATGTFATSFTTPALNPNDKFNVFVKISPTIQTPGLTKTFNLHPVRL